MSMRENLIGEMKVREFQKAMGTGGTRSVPPHTAGGPGGAISPPEKNALYAFLGHLSLHSRNLF